MSQRATDAVIEALYDAALDGSKWPDALRKLQGAVSGMGTILYTVERDHRIPFVVSVDMSPDALSEYANHYVKQCPKIAHLERNPKAKHIYDYKFISEREIGRSEYYAWLQRALGTRYFVGSRLHQDDNSKVFIGVQRTRKTGHVDGLTFKRYIALASHLERAVRVAREIGYLTERANMFELACERAAGAVLLLDGKGRILYANPKAEAFLRGRNAFFVEAGGLRASKSDEDAALQQAVGRAMSDSSLNSDVVDDTVRVTGASGSTFTVRVVPMRISAPTSVTEATLRAVVLIADPNQTAAERAAYFRDVFGLTSSEAAIADSFAAGKDLQQIAAERGIARSTARLHLEHVFRKTGVHRQAELVSLVLKSLKEN